MRILGGSNFLEFDDRVSGGKLGFYYRMPETDEIVAYRNGGTKRGKGKLVSCQTENRIKHGLKVLKGIRDGDFGKPGPDGNALRISSNPGSDDYDPDWKKHVEASAADLVEQLGFFVFEATAKPVIHENKEEQPDGDAASDPDDPE